MNLCFLKRLGSDEKMCKRCGTDDETFYKCNWCGKVREAGSKPGSCEGSSVDGSCGKGWIKNEHDTLTIAEEKIKDLEERLKTERENHNNLFYYWNDKFPDEMREYLNKGRVLS